MLRSVTAVSALLLMTTAVIADTAMSDPFAQKPAEVGVSGLTGLTKVGEDAVFSYWKIDGSDQMISVSKSDGRFFIGYLFSADGKDLSSVVTGFAPLTIPDVQAMISAQIAQTSSEAEAAAAASPSIAAQISELMPQTALAPQRDVTEDFLPQSYEGIRGVEVTDDNVLAKLPANERAAVLADFVERIGKTKTPKEYEDVLNAWRSEIRQKYGAPKPVEESASLSPASSSSLSAKAETSSAASCGVSPGLIGTTPVAASPAAAETSVSDESSSAEHALSVVSSAKWFSVGKSGLPVVYAVVDPTCPYSARFLSSAKDDVEAEKYQLRIVVAPLLSARSGEVISGAVASGNIAKAIFENSDSLAGKSGTPIEPKPFGAMPEAIQRDVISNRKAVIDLGVRAVPFVVWKTADGVKTSTGAPAPGALSQAIPE